jgi:hypothetical protein
MSSSPVPSIANVPTVSDDASPERADPDAIDPATSTKMGSITYDREEASYNLEWESRDDFDKWLTHEQAAIGIEIWLSRTYYPKNSALYSKGKIFCCARNGTGGKKHYVKKTTCERKIDSKRIKGGCPCSVQIKIYPHTNTILGRYNANHSHPVGKDNLRYIRIQVSMHALIEDWVHYGVTDLEIVSDPLFDPD